MAIEDIDGFLKDFRSAQTEQGDSFNAAEFGQAYNRGANRDRTQPESADSLNRKGFVRETAEALAGGVTDTAELWMRAVRAIDPQGGNDVIRNFATFGLDSIKNFVAKHPSLAPDNQAQEGVSRWWQQGVRSLLPSLSAAIPGIIGGAVGGPIGMAAGGGVMSGAIFGLAEFDKFNEEVEERIEELGLSEPEAIAMRAEARNPAIFSALTEGGLEAAANALQVRTLGKFLPGRKTLKNLIKRPIKDIFQKTGKEAIKTGAKQLALTTPVEVGTEFAQAAIETKFRRDVGLTDMDSWGAGMDALGPAFVTNLLFFGAGKSANAAQRWGIRHSLEGAKTDSNKRMKAVRDITNIVRGMDDVNAEGIANKMEAVGASYVASGMKIDINSDLGMNTMLEQYRNGLQDNKINNISSLRLQKTLQQEMDREDITLQQRIPAFQMFQGITEINEEQKKIEAVRTEEAETKVKKKADAADMLEQNAKTATDKQATVETTILVDKEEKPERADNEKAKKIEVTKKAQEDLVNVGKDAVVPDATKDAERERERELAKNVNIKEFKKKSDKNFEEQAKAAEFDKEVAVQKQRIDKTVSEPKPPEETQDSKQLVEGEEKAGEIKDTRPEEEKAVGIELDKKTIDALQKEAVNPDNTQQERDDATLSLQDAGVKVKAKEKAKEVKVSPDKDAGVKSTGESLTRAGKKKGEKLTDSQKKDDELTSVIGNATTRLNSPKASEVKAARIDLKEATIERNKLREDVLEGKVEDPSQSFSTEAVAIANKTNIEHLVDKDKPRVVTQVTSKIATDKNAKILDFGSGKDAKQTEILRSQGFTNVTAHDFGANIVEGLHDPAAMERQYDIVQAGNVLNVQPSEEMLADTLSQIASVTSDKGVAVMNYPTSPRKAGFSVQQVENQIKIAFGNVQKTTKNTWIASQPYRAELKGTANQIEKNNKEIGSKNSAIGASALVKTATVENVRVDQHGIRTVGDSISADMVTKGKVEIIGREVKGEKDIATITQVYRNPQYETFRYIFVKGRKVVGHRGVTSRLPGSVEVFGDDKQKEIGNIKNQMAELDADTIYIMHNHPSGIPTPSDIDEAFTRSLMKVIPEIKSHVIINSGKFAVINSEGGVQVSDIKTNDAILQPSIPNDLLGQRMANSRDVVAIGKQLQVAKGYMTALYTSTTNRVKGIIEIPLSQAIDIKKLTAHIRENAVKLGSQSAVLTIDMQENPKAVQLQESFVEMIEKGVISDVILINGSQTVAIRTEFSIVPKKKEGTFIGEDIGSFVEEAGSKFEEEGGEVVQFEDKDIPDVTPFVQNIFKNKIGPRVKGKTLKEKIGRWTSNWKLKLQQGIVDQYASIQKLDNRLWKLVQVTSSASGAIEAMLTLSPLKLTKEGAADITDTTGKSGLLEVLKPLGDNNEIERFLGREAGLRAEVLLAQGKEFLLDETEIKELKKLNEGNMPDGRSRKSVYRRVRKGLDKLNEATLDFGIASGNIGTAERKEWKEGFHLPFFRLMDDLQEIKGPKSIGGLVGQTPFQKLKGSKRPIADMLTNIVLNWNHIISSSLKNNSARLVLEKASQETFESGNPVATKINVELEVTEDESGDFRVISTKSGKSISGKFDTELEAISSMEVQREQIVRDIVDKSKDTVFVREDGKKVWYQVNDRNLFQSLSSMHVEGFNNRPMKAMRAFKRALTFGVTFSPEFKLRGLFRDTISTAASTPISLNLFDNVFGTGRKATAKNSVHAMRMMTGGGSFQMGHVYGSDSEKLQAQLSKRLKKDSILDNPGAWAKLKRSTSGIIENWNNLGSRAENLNRGALFSQTLEAAQEEGTEGFLEANFQARDVLDFHRHGAWPAIRFLIDVVPFMNARIQSLDKLKRAALGTKAEKQRLALVMGAVSMASMALYLAYKDDDLFKERDEWDRDTYYWFKVPGVETPFRLPKAFEVGAIGTLAERLLEQFVDDEAHGKLFAERLQFMLTETFAIGITPQIAKPVLELMANKNFFTDRPIETLAMENLSPTERRKAWTSETAIVMSQGFSKIPWERVQLSPVQIEHLVQGYLGWIGANILGTVDQIITQPLGGFPGRPSRRIEEYPVFGPFVRTTPSRSTKYSRIFYEGLKEMNQTYADIRNFRTLGETEKAINLARKEKDHLKFRKFANKIQKKIASVTKQIRLVRLSRSLSGDEKRVKIDRLTVTKNKLVKMAAIKISR